MRSIFNLITCARILPPSQRLQAAYIAAGRVRANTLIGWWVRESHRLNMRASQRQAHAKLLPSLACWFIDFDLKEVPFVYNGY